MATILLEGAEKRGGTPADKETPADYGVLSNERLRLLLCRRMPDMAVLPVTDETRETTIAMLKITETGK